MIKSSPELRSLFQAGVRIPTTAICGTHNRPFIGVKFPTYFRLIPEPERGTVPQIECPLGGHGRVRFETDATNDYLPVPTNRARLLSDRRGSLVGYISRDGKATLVLACPENATVGDVVDVGVAVTDPSRTEPFSHRLQLVIVAARDPREESRASGDPDRGHWRYPRLIEIEQDEMGIRGFDAASGLTMHGDTDGGLVAKVNVANEHLRQAMERAPSQTATYCANGLSTVWS